MKPGPYYSKDIKSMGMVAKYDVLYGCDNKNINMDNILEYITNGYFIMLECLYNYAHWIVLLGFYPLADNIEKSKLLIYDPYYNEVRLLNADEFINMWIDGNYLENKIEKDFIAIRRKI